ncbi:MAG TPA: hypothetical protein VGE94_11195 [Chloroflexota bacterium]|jgi:hypothetical protein
MYRHGKVQRRSVAAAAAPFRLGKKARRATAILLTTLLLGTSAVPVAAHSLKPVPDAGHRIFQTLDGVGDSPLVP